MPGLEFLAEARHLGHQRGNVFAPSLGLADALGAGIALVLQFLGSHLQLLALGLERFQSRRIQIDSARFPQLGGKFVGLLAQQVGVEHGATGV